MTENDLRVLQEYSEYIDRK